MALLPGHNGVERVHFELSRHPEWLWPGDPAAKVPDGLTEELLSMSDDIATTVWLMLVWQEEHVATDFLDKVDIEAVVADFRNHAGSCQAARERLAKEVDGLIDAATIYGDRISNLIENEVIVGKEHVRSYCAEKLERTVDSWIEYRARLQKVVGSW